MLNGQMYISMYYCIKFEAGGRFSMFLARFLAAAEQGFLYFCLLSIQ